MKTIILLALVLMLILAACSPPPASNNGEGEDEEEVEKKIEFSLLPEQVTLNEPFNIAWIISGFDGIISSTAIYYGAEGDNKNYDKEMAPSMAPYSDSTDDFSVGEFLVPDEFATTITPRTEGILYLRGYFEYYGRNYWTKEIPIYVFAPPKKKELDEDIIFEDEFPIEQIKDKPEEDVYNGPPLPDDFEIVADNNSLAPDTITVRKGNTISIEFIVSSENTGPEGLMFDSNLFKTSPIKPGTSKVVVITVNKETRFSSLNPPGDGAPVARGTIKVV